MKRLDVGGVRPLRLGHPDVLGLLVRVHLLEASQRGDGQGSRADSSPASYFSRGPLGQDGLDNYLREVMCHL